MEAKHQLEIERGEVIITGELIHEYNMAKAVYDAKRIVNDISWLTDITWNLSSRREKLWKLLTQWKQYKRYIIPR